MESTILKVDKIKLVIWDLDETFWKGTLSEEGIIPIPGHLNLVKELSHKGIINSIVSKNDFSAAKEQLIRLGVWDYFVFPAIEWKPKGLLIKAIIDNCQLRSNNVLFLDDNHSNLEEAQFYNPDIHAYPPEFIHQIHGHEAFVGKNDHSLSRLNQYKLLEKKQVQSKSFNSNEDFLKASDIKLIFIEELTPHLERIHELLDRTNQLNFTKKRSTIQEIEALIQLPHKISRLIQVKDKFGDYGLVGFYTLDKKTNVLDHFVFSCRILNLGIPHYIYAKLGKPKLAIIPEVAERLDGAFPTWISEMGSSITHESSVKKSRLKVIFRGPCDFKQTLFYLSNMGVAVSSETNYVHNQLPVYPAHTQTLVNSLELSLQRKEKIARSASIPFIDQSYFSTAVFSAKYDCLIYSLQLDYSQHLYVQKKTGIQLALGKNEGDLTQVHQHETLIKTLKSRGISGYSSSMLARFAEDFEHIGLIQPDQLIQNLKKIREAIPSSIPIILLNALPATESGQQAMDHGKLLDQAVGEFVNSSENTYFINLKNFFRMPVETLGRQNYLELSNELLTMLGRICNTDLQSSVKSSLVWKNKLRMAYLLTKSFFRKSIWIPLKNLHFLVASEIITELEIGELLVAASVGGI